jgi:hypothetical protein
MTPLLSLEPPIYTPARSPALARPATAGTLALPAFANHLTGKAVGDRNALILLTMLRPLLHKALSVFDVAAGGCLFRASYFRTRAHCQSVEIADLFPGSGIKLEP